MITWTTYGSWLQGDKRGYVKDGETLDENKGLYNANKANQKGEAVTLTERGREIIRNAIIKESERLGQKIYAITVCPKHVHIVTNCINEKFGKIAGRYKKAATDALKEAGFVTKIWTKGFDKRFCFDEKSLKERIDYVEKHNQNGITPGGAK